MSKYKAKLKDARTVVQFANVLLEYQYDLLNEQQEASDNCMFKLAGQYAASVEMVDIIIQMLKSTPLLDQPAGGDPSGDLYRKASLEMSLLLGSVRSRRAALEALEESIVHQMYDMEGVFGSDRTPEEVQQTLFDYPRPQEPESDRAIRMEYERQEKTTRES